MLFIVIPGVTLVVLAGLIVWGDKGMMRQLELKTQLGRADVELADIQRQNQRMLRQLKAIETDSRILERIAGEELNMGVVGARIIRFDVP